MSRPSELLDEIGWSALEFGRQLRRHGHHVNDRTVRRWLDELNEESPFPPELLAWLEGVAAFLGRFKAPAWRTRREPGGQ